MFDRASNDEGRDAPRLEAIAPQKLVLSAAAQVLERRGTFLDFCIARRVAIRRKHMEMTCGMLAAALRCDVSWVHLMETHIVPLEPNQVASVAAALDTPIEYFYRDVMSQRRKLLLADGQRPPF